jgi:hypothetical protein
VWPAAALLLLGLHQVPQAFFHGGDGGAQLAHCGGLQAQAHHLKIVRAISDGLFWGSQHKKSIKHFRDALIFSSIQISPRGISGSAYQKARLAAFHQLMGCGWVRYFHFKAAICLGSNRFKPKISWILNSSAIFLCL